MMMFKFKKGKHRASPLYWLRWWPLLIAPKKIARRVVFSHESRYELSGGDQEDINKLFGVAFGRVHKNSARFGWMYQKETDSFILTSYIYVNGERIVMNLCHCRTNESYRCEVHIKPLYYNFIVWHGDILFASEVIFHFNQTKIGWLLGPYFGGNQSAPNNQSLRLSKK